MWCMHVCWCANPSRQIQGLEIDVCSSQLHLYLFFEIGSLIEPGAHHFCQTGWPANPTPPGSACLSLPLGYIWTLPHLTFKLVLMIAWQTLEACLESFHLFSTGITSTCHHVQHLFLNMNSGMKLRSSYLQGKHFASNYPPSQAVAFLKG